MGILYKLSINHNCWHFKINMYDQVLHDHVLSGVPQGSVLFFYNLLDKIRFACIET